MATLKNRSSVSPGDLGTLLRRMQLASESQIVAALIGVGFSPTKLFSKVRKALGSLLASTGGEFQTLLVPAHAATTSAPSLVWSSRKGEYWLKDDDDGLGDLNAEGQLQATIERRWSRALGNVTEIPAVCTRSYFESHLQRYTPAQMAGALMLTSVLVELTKERGIVPGWVLDEHFELSVEVSALYPDISNRAVAACVPVPSTPGYGLELLEFCRVAMSTFCPIEYYSYGFSSLHELHAKISREGRRPAGSVTSPSGEPVPTTWAMLHPEPEYRGGFFVAPPVDHSQVPAE